MSDKERLEEIKSRVWKEPCTYAVGDDSSREGYRYILADEDYHWLMERAERVEELEKDLDEWKKEALQWFERFEESQKSRLETKKLLKSIVNQNKRYREALNSIITLWIASTDATDDTWLAHEMSETARKALEG